MAKGNSKPRKSPETDAAEAIRERAFDSFMVLRDITQNIGDCPFNGWTINKCLTFAVRDVTKALSTFPKPGDARKAKQVSAALEEATDALQTIEGSARFFGNNFNAGIKKSPARDRAVTLAAGMERLALMSAKALDRADELIGLPPADGISWEV